MRRTIRYFFLDYLPKGAHANINEWTNPSEVTAEFRRTEAAAVLSDKEKENRGFFYLPCLDYDTGVGIPPLMSRAQFDIQYDFFHRDAVKRLNTHTLGDELEGHPLEVVIRNTAFDAARAVIHIAASEHFNYCFWYRSLRPWGTKIPLRIKERLRLQYGYKAALDPIAEVKRLFTVTALSHQRLCGWIYLVWTGKSFDVVEFDHGMCPIGSNLTPLMALNLHESALCIDYNVQDNSTDAVERYVNNFFKTCNWLVANRYFSMAIGESDN
ncbi:unnamed protein product [Phytomonas sp. Hart1]|nr:unnamed protein product [Phytomonas sp. Hart1]|eukprot:CCW68129.1 unnamed protein product [Phytomonas sp. isolate Hart1]